MLFCNVSTVISKIISTAEILIDFFKRIVAALVLYKSVNIYYLLGSDVKKQCSTSSSCLSAVTSVTARIADSCHVRKNQIKSRAASNEATCNDHPIRKVCEYCFCKGLNIL